MRSIPNTDPNSTITNDKGDTMLNLTMASPRRRGRRATVRRSAAWAVAAALVAAVAACGGDDGGGDAATTTAAADSSADTQPVAGGDALAPQPLAEQTTVRVAWPVGVEAFAPVIVADALKEFEAENIKVEFIVVPPAEAIALLQTDRADVWITSLNATLFNARTADIDLRIVAPTFFPNPESHSGLWLASKFFDDAGDLDVEELRGARIALGAGGLGASTSPLIDQWMQSIGLTLNDIEIDSSLNGADILVGMEGGGIDGGWLSDPVWITAEEDGLGKPVVTQAGDFGKYSLSAYVAHGRFIDDEADVARAFFRALARTNRDHLQGDYHGDAAVVDAIAAATGTPADSITSSLPLVFDPTLTFDTEILDILQATWLSVGDVLEYSEAIPAADIVDQSVITAVDS